MAKTPATAPTAMDIDAIAGAAPETIAVRSHRIACDGVGGALGHPRVWLEMGAAGFVDCSYCDRRFVAATGEGDEDERLAPGVYEGAGGH
ncbi:zinc-finger domain-containing protein [Caulobacter sp.]|uniref:zinc-finger domain-containing protein n=1 Tax=Caulobacter sp. TaxID=78 RepID=UPI001B01686C|nr:zinc-finger domain-containing protein [Caulobacter sp.]MBO9545338.1 zinc-finger domain-containing protein [Caulobacter sp.]